jgi:hypothetical protein
MMRVRRVEAVEKNVRIVIKWGLVKIKCGLDWILSR